MLETTAPSDNASAMLPPVPECPAVITLDTMIAAYLQDYELREFRMNIARCRTTHLRMHLGGDRPAAAITSLAIREYQVTRRREGAAAATVNRETSALSRMFRLVVVWGWLEGGPIFPPRLRESQPRQGFFEHEEYLRVRHHLPASWQDILDFAYYSGWRKQEIIDLTWHEVDLPGRVARLAPVRSKTGTSRVLPLSAPLLQVLERRNERRGDSSLVFGRDGMTVRDWRTAFRQACDRAGLPGRLIHDCRRTAARNLIRAGVPERVAMLLTGHRTRSIFDRYNIVNEQDLLAAGERLNQYIQQTASRSSETRSGKQSRPKSKR